MVQNRSGIELIKLGLCFVVKQYPSLDISNDDAFIKFRKDFEKIR
jgi:hypothetical protein